MLLNNVKLVIFDMDGLLIDSEKVYSEGWAEGIRYYNGDVPEDIVYKMSGQSPKQNSELLNTYLNDTTLVQNIRNIRKKYFINQLELGNVELKPYSKDLLINLKENSYTTAIATTTDSNSAIKILNHHDLFSLFDYSIFGDQVKEVKPAPDLYLNILDQSGISKENSIILEDSLTGASAGRNAGVNVILVPDPKFTDMESIDDDNIVAIHNHLGEVFHYFF